ncbi:MAG: YraN family protein [Fulvivirga sp.]
MSTELGKQGEARAADFLRSKGYEIIETNYRHKRNEIDLIAQYKNTLVFVEVKSKGSVSYGFPEEAVDSKKAARIIEAAEQYVFEQNWQGLLRFDIVAIINNNENSEINHFEDAFY